MGPRAFLLLAVGVLVGRVASEQFSSGPLQLLDLVTYLSVAFGLAWAWRSWARRALEERRRETLRRQGGGRRRRRASQPAPEETDPQP